MTVLLNDKHNVFYDEEITENTISLAIDYSGGMSDRLMLGRKGILYNANCSIECFNNDTDEYIIKPFDINSTSDEDLEQAIGILQTDNFEIVLVLEQTIVADELVVGKDLITTSSIEQSKHMTVVDIDKIEFDENGLYHIY